MGACPICKSGLSKEADTPTGDYTAYHCPHCGDFKLSGTLGATLPNKLAQASDAAHKLSHWLRRNQSSNKVPMITDLVADEIVKQPLPRPHEQADLLVRWLGDNLAGPGEETHINFLKHGAIVGSKSPNGFRLVYKHLHSTGLLTGLLSNEMSGDSGAHITLTFAGWQRYESFARGATNYSKAFMAMKFGNKDLDKVFAEVFVPATKQAGFDLLRIDHDLRAGLIDNKMRVEIQTSSFVIADLSHDNNGAYWEAGYAEGLGKPVIYTCESKKFAATKSHFDTNHHLTIEWDASNPQDAGKLLTASIRATLPQLAKMVDE